MPPKAKHDAAREWLSGNRSGVGLSADERSWLGRHRTRRAFVDTRKLVDEGRELYNLIVRAHGKGHCSAKKTWGRLYRKYVVPSQEFIDDWVMKCPSCN